MFHLPSNEIKEIRGCQRRSLLSSWSRSLTSDAVMTETDRVISTCCITPVTDGCCNLSKCKNVKRALTTHNKNNLSLESTNTCLPATSEQMLTVINISVSEYWTWREVSCSSEHQRDKHHQLGELNTLVWWESNQNQGVPESLMCCQLIGRVIIQLLIGIISSQLEADHKSSCCCWVLRTPTLWTTPLMKNWIGGCSSHIHTRAHTHAQAHTQTGNDPAPPYLQTVQADETGDSKSINDILLLRAGLASLPPEGTRCSGSGCGVRRRFTGQGGGVPPRTVSLPVGAGGVGVGAAGVSASCLPQPPHPLPLGPASPAGLQFAIHVVGESL